MGPVAGIRGMAGAHAKPWADRACGWSAAGIAMAGDEGALQYEGGIVVVADARLDNAAALAATLGLASGASTGALIAAAYRCWGEDCPARLEGVFAFALWDAPRRRLLCARDLMGVRPLFYRSDGAALRFAKSADALATGTDRARTLRDEAVADFLYGRVLDAQGTWFAGVERLPAGHILSFTDGALRLRRFARITPVPFAAGGDIAGTLRQHLDAAVARQAEGCGNVGALLSGGLDSSSIACLLRDRRHRQGGPPLPVFAMMFREPAQSNERRHFDAVVATGGFAPHVLELDGYAPFAGFETLLGDMGGPTLSPNIACMRHVLAAAVERGVDVIFDGHGGDEVIGHGYGLLDELAARGAWGSLWREARGAADNYGRSRLVLTRRVAARQQRIDARIIARLLSPFDKEAVPVARRPPAHLLSRDLVTRSRLAERLRSFAKPEAVGSEQGQHLAVVNDPLQPYGFEVHAALTRAAGVKARYPFWDRQVVEYCLGMPAAAKLSDGWSRLALRRAMAGIVPDSVLQRRDKIDFTVHLARGLVHHHHDRLTDLFGGDTSPLAPYVDLAKARSLYAALAADPDAATGRSVQMIWRAAALGIWLEMGCGGQTSGAVPLREVAA
jgi:asparagine synthase (glutamine-hydrolysing)